MINKNSRVLATSFLLIFASLVLSLAFTAVFDPVEPLDVFGTLSKPKDEILVIPKGGIEKFLEESSQKARENLEARKAEDDRSKNISFLRGIMSQSWFVIWIPWALAALLSTISNRDALVYLTGPLTFFVFGVIEWHSAVVMGAALVVVALLKRAVLSRSRQFG